MTTHEGPLTPKTLLNAPESLEGLDAIVSILEGLRDSDQKVKRELRDKNGNCAVSLALTIDLLLEDDGITQAGYQAMLKSLKGTFGKHTFQNQDGDMFAETEKGDKSVCKAPELFPYAIFTLNSLMASTTRHDYMIPRREVIRCERCGHIIRRGHFARMKNTSTGRYISLCIPCKRLFVDEGILNWDLPSHENLINGDPHYDNSDLGIYANARQYNLLWSTPLLDRWRHYDHLNTEADLLPVDMDKLFIGFKAANFFEGVKEISEEK